MSNQETSNPRNEEKNALVELVILARKYGNEIKAHWKLILALVLVLVALSLIRKKLTKTTYQATLSFMVNEDEGSQLGGLSAALEDLGFGFGGSTSEYNLEKIMEIMRSQRIIYESLLEKETVKGKEDFYANHLIEVYDLHKVWTKKKPKIKDLVFTHDSLPAFNIKEMTGLNLIYKMVLGMGGDTPLLKSEILDLPAIMNFTLTSQNEELSYKFVNSIYENLSTFYVDKSIEKQKETYKIVSSEVDSIRKELASKEYELASFEDRNQSLIGNRVQLRKERLERDVLIITAIYAEALANEEVARFTLRKETPFIQSIDIPRPPLKRVQESLSKAITKGVLAGLIISLAFIIGRFLVREVIEGLPQSEESA